MFNNKLLFKSNPTGLGDRLLDIFGFMVLCKYKKCKPIIIFNANEYICEWGNNTYNELLFIFEDIELTNQYAKIDILENHSSVILSPTKLFLYLSKSLKIKMDYLLFLKEYDIVSKQIKPSKIIENNIPQNLNNVYGIHLRKSDKVLINAELEHESTPEQFNIIMNQLITDIIEIILTELCPSFLLVSEDNEWKSEFHNRLLEISNKNNKPINIIQINYEPSNHLQGYASVLDMFCLSRCKRIYQGVKYSTFSLLSALIGNVPVINYAYLLDDYEKCYLHSWSPVININNVITTDIKHDIGIKLDIPNIIYYNFPFCY